MMIETMNQECFDDDRNHDQSITTREADGSNSTQKTNPYSEYKRVSFGLIHIRLLVTDLVVQQQHHRLIFMMVCSRCGPHHEEDQVMIVMIANSKQLVRLAAIAQAVEENFISQFYTTPNFGNIALESVEIGEGNESPNEQQVDLDFFADII